MRTVVRLVEEGSEAEKVVLGDVFEQGGVLQDLLSASGALLGEYLDDCFPANESDVCMRRGHSVVGDRT